MKRVFDIYCPFCAIAYFRTNRNFDPAKIANGSMIDMKEPWAGYGWTGPPKDESVQFANLHCPSCGPGASLVDLQGRFVHAKEIEPPPPEHVCQICGQVFKSHHARGGHMKSHGKEKDS
jgi:hypothetical protein